jgi:hypothetical protein
MVNLTINHNFISPIEDAGQAGIVGPDEWNEALVYEGQLPIENGGTGTTTGHIFNNTTFINSQDDFETQDATTITLGSSQKYIINNPVLLTKEIIIPDNADISFESSFAANHFLVYAGSGTLFTGSPRFLFFEGKLITLGNPNPNGAPDGSTATLFDLSLSSQGRSTLFCEAGTNFSFWNDLGTIDSFTTIVMKTVDRTQYAAGLKIIGTTSPIPETNLQIGGGRHNNTLGAAGSGDAGLQLSSGAFDTVTITGETYQPRTGEAALYIDPSASIANGEVTSNVFTKTNGGTLLFSGSVDQTDINWNFQNNGQARGSITAGEMTMLANTSETVITTINTPVIINGTTTAGFIERFTHSNQRLTYVGLKDIVTRIDAKIRVESNANNEADSYRFIAYKNGSEVVGVEDLSPLGQALATPVVLFQLMGNIEMETDDYIEIFVENQSSTQNIKVISQDVHVEKIE